MYYFKEVIIAHLCVKIGLLYKDVHIEFILYEVYKSTIDHTRISTVEKFKDNVKTNHEINLAHNRYPNNNIFIGMIIKVANIMITAMMDQITLMKLSVFLIWTVSNDNNEVNYEDWAETIMVGFEESTIDFILFVTTVTVIDLSFCYSFQFLI